MSRVTKAPRPYYRPYDEGNVIFLRSPSSSGDLLTDLDEDDYEEIKMWQNLGIPDDMLKSFCKRHPIDRLLKKPKEEYDVPTELYYKYNGMLKGVSQRILTVCPRQYDLSRNSSKLQNWPPSRSGGRGKHHPPAIDSQAVS